MSVNPLVTVGAINYNNAPWVLETLESIANQTYDNIELIIVDDCSTDESIAIIEKWLEQYNKPYKFIKHDKNYGVCRASNDALGTASGKYFSYIATDDIMMPEKIAKQVQLLETAADDVCAVYSDAYLINADSTPRYGWFVQRHRNFKALPSGDIYDELMYGNFIPAMSILVKMECYKQVGFFDEDLQYEDYDMWLRLAQKYKFIISEYVSVKYRIRDNSLSFKSNTWNKSNIKIISKHIGSNMYAMEKIRHLAREAYLKNDIESIQLLKSIKHDSFVRKVLMLRIVPRFLGIKILYRI